MTTAAPTLRTRPHAPRTAWALEQAGIDPLLARLYAARGVRSADELDDALDRLLHPSGLRGADAAGAVLADAVQRGQRVCVVADYDCDGATACTVALRGLALLGAERSRLGFVVPDRAVHGYGLTPAIVDLALRQRPDVLLTVDNGIASIEGVAHARRSGLTVVITDHHLPAVRDGATVLPDAHVVVNPNQPGCSFESKHLAGVGVIFYVLLAARAELRRRGTWTGRAEPALATLLDLVALGTVADVVALDANNRRLVAQGLKRIRQGRMQPGVAALFAVAGRDTRRASAFDFGFALGPRINAAGRLQDMSIGIDCLMADDPARAQALAAELDTLNRDRRDVEAGVRSQAEATVDAWSATDGPVPSAVTLYGDDFHEGVVGIVAGRLKDRLHRPTFVFARGQDGLLKGSGRSIAGFHLRDALDLLSKRHPGVLRKFGGHAMAAGCTLGPDDLAVFDTALAQIAAERLTADTLAQTLLCDGPLPDEHYTLETALRLQAQVWGQTFEAPMFLDTADVLSQRLVGEKHLKLALRVGTLVRDAVWFGREEPLPARPTVAYRVQVDSYNGRDRLQMVIAAGADLDRRARRDRRQKGMPTSRRTPRPSDCGSPLPAPGTSALPAVVSAGRRSSTS